MTTFSRLHAATAVAADLDANLEDLSRVLTVEPVDLHLRLLISDAQISAKRTLKHLRAATQMAANAEADRVNQIAAE